MSLLATAGKVLLTPNAWLIGWVFLIAIALLMGGMTAAKGRWGWFLLGWVTGGLLWLVAGFLRASPGSLWARRVRPARHR